MKVDFDETSLERQRALEAVLTSNGFRRAEQLKRLLIYLVEQDSLGRSAELTEYELGTKVLGRGEDFSPETDSTVRTRMHGLRQKLEEFYGANPDGLRIEIPKGSYRPQYRLMTPELKPEPRRWWLVGVAGLVVAVMVLMVWLAGRKSPLEQLWGPMLDSQQSPALLVGQPLHVWVRDVQGQAAPVDYVHFPDPMPSSPEFRLFAGPRLGLGAVPVLHPSPNATLWGDAAGAASAVRFFAFRKISAEMLPESTLKNGVSLRGRPVLAFGRPEYSPAVQRYLASAGGYTIGMINEIQRYAVFRLGHPGERFLNTKPPNEVNHGLVTVLNDGPARVMVFSGITSDGSVAGLEYFTNEKSAAELFARIGRRQWPAVFQVVLRVSSNSGYAMAAQYEKHLILED